MPQATTPMKVDFAALINNEICFISALPEDRISVLFGHLRADGSIPGHVRLGDATFYRFKQPVSMGLPTSEEEADQFAEEAKQACLEMDNRVSITKWARVSFLHKEELNSENIYLVIDFPDRVAESAKAMDSIKARHSTLFQCLQVTVEQLGKWTLEDVSHNKRILNQDSNDDDHGLTLIRKALEAMRKYQANEISTTHELQCARRYETEFARIFMEVSGPEDGTAKGRELVTFYHMLRCFNANVAKITDRNSSPSLKTSNFIVHFIQPPFLSDPPAPPALSPFVFLAEKAWSFPMFVNAQSAPNTWRKFTPRSDWMVVSSKHKIPFVISEVISQKSRQDRHRMLVQATALARAGQYLMKSSSQKRFFIVAIYLDAAMVASRYIVMQKKSGNTAEAVSIQRKDFVLTDPDSQVDFLREMYNLAAQITVLSHELDEAKEEVLTRIENDANNVISLSRKTWAPKTAGNATLDSIAEGNEEGNESQDEDDLGVFKAEDIQEVLREMKYSIEFIPWGHPELAVIVSEAGDKHGYLKFVTRSSEVQVLQYLSQIESPLNYTIADVRFWPVHGGTVISMPVAGGWLTSLKNLDGQLWSVAQQLFEAVGFMHEQHVAHMDIKPQNVIIPPEGGRLSIIDFSVSIRVRGPKVRYNGVVGTEKYIAPEVRQGNYLPMVADLWSCGKTLEELCLMCGPSPERTELLRIAGDLMNRDPEGRPKISAVLARIAIARPENKSP